MLYKDFVEAVEETIKEKNLDRDTIELSVCSYEDILDREIYTDRIIDFEIIKGCKEDWPDEICINAER